MDVWTGSWEPLVGIAAIPTVLPVLVQHVKRAVGRGDGRGRETARTPWPLLTDAGAVAWVLALWSGGQLGEGDTRPAVTTAILMGLVAGAAASFGYDGWRRLLRGRDADNDPRS